jgi:hypothetical protein
MLVPPSAGIFSTQSSASAAVLAERSCGSFFQGRTSPENAIRLNVEPSGSPQRLLHLAPQHVDLAELLSTSLPAHFMDPEKSRMNSTRVECDWIARIVALRRVRRGRAFPAAPFPALALRVLRPAEALAGDVHHARQGASTAG